MAAVRGSRQCDCLLTGRAAAPAAVKSGPSRRGSASELCVPSMFDSWRGESPRTNLMEVKDSEAQGLPSRDGV